jgi:hypothetical protein
MKNSAKIAAAEEILATARSLGFENAYLAFTDDFVNDGSLCETLEEIASEYGPNDRVSASIHLILDDDLAFELVEDPDDEDGEPRIEYIK